MLKETTINLDPSLDLLLQIKQQSDPQAPKNTSFKNCRVIESTLELTQTVNSKAVTVK